MDCEKYFHSFLSESSLNVKENLKKSILCDLELSSDDEEYNDNKSKTVKSKQSSDYFGTESTFVMQLKCRYFRTNDVSYLLYIIHYKFLLFLKRNAFHKISLKKRPKENSLTTTETILPNNNKAPLSSGQVLQSSYTVKKYIFSNNCSPAIARRNFEYISFLKQSMTEDNHLASTLIENILSRYTTAQIKYMMSFILDKFKTNSFFHIKMNKRSDIKALITGTTIFHNGEIFLNVTTNVNNNNNTSTTGNNNNNNISTIGNNNNNTSTNGNNKNKLRKPATKNNKNTEEFLFTYCPIRHKMKCCSEDYIGYDEDSFDSSYILHLYSPEFQLKWELLYKAYTEFLFFPMINEVLYLNTSSRNIDLLAQLKIMKTEFFLKVDYLLERIQQYVIFNQSSPSFMDLNYQSSNINLRSSRLLHRKKKFTEENEAIFISKRS